MYGAIPMTRSHQYAFAQPDQCLRRYEKTFQPLDKVEPREFWFENFGRPQFAHLQTDDHIRQQARENSMMGSSNERQLARNPEQQIINGLRCCLEHHGIAEKMFVQPHHLAGDMVHVHIQRYGARHGHKGFGHLLRFGHITFTPRFTPAFRGGLFCSARVLLRHGVRLLQRADQFEACWSSAGPAPEMKS